MIWLGNYNIMRGVNATGISDKHIDGAVACYKTVLEIQPTNLYAANGLGMVSSCVSCFEPQWVFIKSATLWFCHAAGTFGSKPCN